MLCHGYVIFPTFHHFTAYHNEKFGLTEFQSGLLLSLNGLLILEMPIVSISQRKGIDKLKIILWDLY
jgi:hypothetical protein